MKTSKPLFIKTYGKQRRKLSAWISPQDRKQAFDSTLSTDDTSVFEPPNPKKIRGKSTAAGGHRATRPAKAKAMRYLTEKSCEEENMSNEENIIPSPPRTRPAQQSKTTRQKKTSVDSGRAVRPAKRKAVMCLDTSSDEENIRRPSPPLPQFTQRSKTTRKGQLASVSARQVSVTSESEVETSAPKCLKNSDKRKTHSNVHPPSAGRFVTRRRRAATIKPKLIKAINSILSSSDDFTSSRIHRPSRRRRVPPVFGMSSAENSVNAAGTSSCATNPFREISLNELADHSLGPCSRKPMFCSTPSASSFDKHGDRKPFPVNDQSSTPPSISVSCIGVLSTFHEDLESSEKPISPPQSASPLGLHSEEKLQKEPDLHHHIEPSVDLFLEAKRSSCSGEAISHSDDSKTKKGEELQSVDLSSIDSGSSSHFISATGALEWLIEALKEKCLSERCTVQLERLDFITVTQLCSQTTYSSCLDSSSVHIQQTDEQPESVNSGQTVDLSQSSGASLNLHLSVTNRKTGDCLQSVNSFEEDSVARLPIGNAVETLFTAEEALAAKDKCLNKRCSVQIQKLSLSQQTVQHLEGSVQQKEAGLACSENAVNQEDLRQSKSNNIPVQTTQSVEPETEERAAALTKVVKEKCLNDKFVVGLKRLTVSQVKDILLLRSPADISDLASDDQTRTDHRSESDCHEDTKTNSKYGGSTSFDDKTASDKEVVKNSCNIAPKRKKTSLAPKEKKGGSTSTTRKACVSGMSVNRWKNKSSTSTQVFRSRTAQTGGAKAMDCSITELISTQHKQPRELLGTAMNFSTPVKASRLNLSSLLADLTPNTHTWSRLKAALSVHRRGMVLVTPKSLRLSAAGSPGRMELADVSQDLFATPLRTPLPKHLRSQLQSHHSLVVCEDEDLSDAEKVYAECGQRRPLPWEECILPQRMKQCVKIGEGTFGEVFSTTNASGDTVALKIIPVEGSEKVNGEEQKTFGEILHEIIISKELSSLKDKQQNQTRGFIGLNDLHCVQGCYPPDFLKAWDKFDQQKGSENDRPDFFEKDQLFIILEFEFGGMDLENSNGTLASLGVAKSILHQVTAALAVAEQELHFEHRDLHWGNVLVKTTRQKMGSFLLNGTTHTLENKGVLVRIIDYSLSRLEIDDLTVSCDISNDEELFMGQGDYQFDVYRLMRQENGNNWSNYHPHTNVLWLHYLCSKLLSMKYRNPGGRGAKDMREELTRFYDNILQYSSATEALQNCPMFQ